MRSNRGFTLAELAVAFVIIALLLAGALIPLSTQIEVRNIGDTRRVMDQIKEALIGYAQANGRLPCPADGSISSNTAGAGVEQSNGTSCTAAVGVIPWSTLGVPETDAWGRRFTFRVSPAFADILTSFTWQTRLTDPAVAFPPQTLSSPTSPANQSPTCTPSISPTLSSFALCTVGDIAVLRPNPADHALFTAIGTGLPAVFLSHGRNGNGAYQTNGIRLAVSATTNEAANSSGTTTATPGSGNNYPSYVFYSRDPAQSVTPCDDTTGSGVFCEFDDIIYMISPSTLVARMISAGRLP